LVIGAAIWLVATAAALPAGAAESGCDSPPFRAFDFWLGEWEVSSADGRRAGRNEISREQHGCVLVERWQGVEDSTGLSMNVYDPVKQRWRQLWVSPGIQIDITGGIVDGSMLLEGILVDLKDGVAHPFRGTWTPLDDGRVRQFFEQANEAGEWTPWFEGFYRRLDAATPGAS
jgi:hypothetical protein